MTVKGTITVNGRAIPYETDAQLSLMRFLREYLGLMGVKNGCEQGHCGACTVIVNGRAQRSCLLRMGKLDGAQVVTVEGLSQNGFLDVVQQAFVEEGAIQCGFCTPGMILAAKALLDQNPHPTDDEIKKALRFNICRCTGYVSILRAIHRAVRMKDEGWRPMPAPQDNAMPIGRSLPRVDAVEKVCGKPIFADDYTAPNMLIGKLLYPPYAHARIRAIDVTAAAQAPGVALVLTGKDIPGINQFGVFRVEQPVLATDEVRFLGDPVAAVFAQTREQAEYARSLIQVDYEPLPALLSPQEAAKPGATPVLPGHKDNLAHEVHVRKGDVDMAFADADVIVEGDYETPAVEHAYLEPESCFAKPDGDGGVTVWTGSQGSEAFRQAIADNLAIPKEKVRVVLTACGGAFGGKEEPTVQVQAALAALRTGRPVKITLTRQESIRTSVKRHPMSIHMKHAAKRDGTVTAVESYVVADGGAYLSSTQPVVFRSAVICTGPYDVANVRADSYGYYTHHNPSGAFRGFGSTQATFAAEVQMDKIARALHMDPIALRRKNALRSGSRTCTGQVLQSGVGYLGTLADVGSRIEQLRRVYGSMERPAHVKFGVGVASAYKNVGIGTGLPDGGSAVVEITPEGRVRVCHGAAEIGQGCNTVAAQIAAAQLHVPYDLIDVVSCDTAICPDGGMTTASRQTYVMGNAVKKTADLLYKRLSSYLADGEVTQASLRAAFQASLENGEPLRAEATYIPPKTYPHQTDANHHPGQSDEEFDIHYAYCFVTMGVAVEVDTKTGAVKVLKVLASQDVGRAINPHNVIGQIEGSVAMGMGYALTEQFLEDDTQVLTDTLQKCHLPNFSNIPDIDAMYVEVKDDNGPYGAKGIGEVGLNPMAPAISNAIYDAVGVRAQSLPITREKLLALLHQKEQDAET